MPSSGVTASRWRRVRRVYAIYVAIASRFALAPAPPFPDLNSIPDDAEGRSLETAEQWLAEMDRIIQPHQFRQVLQQIEMSASEDKLHALVERHLQETHRTDSDRDKLAFLLTQYLWVCAPPSFRSRAMTLEETAEVLEPVLGECPLEAPEWMQDLTACIADMQRCASVGDIRTQRIVERGRQIKAGAGNRYFGRTALLFFTYFNACLRRTFFRAILADSKTIEDGLQQLEIRQVRTVEYNASGTVMRTPIAEVREQTKRLSRRFADDYGDDNSWKLFETLRAAVQTALERTRSTFSNADEGRVAALEAKVQMLQEYLQQLQTELASRNRPSEAPAPPPPAQLGPQLVVENSKPVLELSNDDVLPLTPQPPPDPLAVMRDEIANWVNRVRAELGHAKTTTGVIRARGVTMLLNSAEIEALQSSNNGPAETLRNSVALRMMLIDRMRNGKAQEGDPLSEASRRFVHVLDETASRSGPAATSFLAASRQIATLLRQLEASAARQLKSG